MPGTLQSKYVSVIRTMTAQFDVDMDDWLTAAWKGPTKAVGARVTNVLPFAFCFPW